MGRGDAMTRPHVPSSSRRAWALSHGSGWQVSRKHREQVAGISTSQVSAQVVFAVVPWAKARPEASSGLGIGSLPKGVLQGEE